MKTAVIIGAARTPIGLFLGAYGEISAPRLGSVAIREALRRSKAKPESIDEVLMGCVLPAGVGQAPARQAAIGAGLPPSVGATTINKVCGSGLKAVMLATQAIRSEDAETLVAGGMESMSRAPYLIDKGRTGYRMGSGELVDSMIRDGLWDVYNDYHMGNCGEMCAEKYGFTRADQDAFAIESYRRAREARSKGEFKEEIAPVEIPVRKGDPIVVDADEEPTRFDEAKFRKLRAAFKKDGTVTAGNASTLNDGAAALVVTTSENASRLGAEVLGRVIGYAQHAQEPEWFTTAPLGALKKLHEKLGLGPKDIELYEINEAFSTVTMAAMKDLDLDHARVNIRGGAVALGHPIGASGARILVTLLYAMKARKAKRGIACLCIGGGEAVALAVERT